MASSSSSSAPSSSQAAPAESSASAKKSPWNAPSEGDVDPLEELLRSVERGAPAGDAFSSEDPDIQALEALTKRLANSDLEIGKDIFGEDADGLMSGGVDSDEDDFTERLLREFRQMTQADATVPRSRLKEVYLDVLQRGAEFMQDRNSVESFLSGLSPAEMQAVMELLANTPEGVIRTFNGDPDVVEALRNAPDIPTLFGGASGESAPGSGSEERLFGGNLGFSAFDFIDSDDSLDEDEETIASKVASASDAIKRGLEVFRADILHYVQNPEELMKLASSMPSPKEQNEFLDLIFAQYTPERLREDLQFGGGSSGRGPSKKSEGQGGHVEDLQEVMDPQLVAHVFKEVLTRFKAFKANPHRFDALTQRLNKLEMQAFESLVEAFWDVGPADFRL